MFRAWLPKVELCPNSQPKPIPGLYTEYVDLVFPQVYHEGMVKHSYTVTERQLQLLKRSAEKLGITVGELLRRILDAHFSESTKHAAKLVIILACLAGGCALKSPLVLPTAAYAVAATTDGVTTYRVLKAGGKEDNPLVSWAPNMPTMFTIGAAIDTAGVYAWNRYVGRKHPKLAAIGLCVAAIGRIYLATHNIDALRQQREINRRRQ